MSQINRLNSRILQLERAHDDLLRDNLRYRDKLPALAKACTECRGTGVVIQVTWGNRGTRVESQSDCTECADIRKVLFP